MRSHTTINLFFFAFFSYLFTGLHQASSQDQNQIASDPFTFSASVQGGLAGNFSGGLKNATKYIGRTHLTLSLNTEQASFWKNGEFFINAVNMIGGDFTQGFIGDFQPISRNEATPERTGLFELWYKHTIGRAFIIVGQHDMNTSLGTSKYAGNSINSAFGMNPSLTPNAGYSFSIYPRTMPAIYVGYDGIKVGSGSISLRSAIYAGAAQDFEEDRYNLEWNFSNGTHSRFELHYLRKQSTVKLGLMYHSGNFISVLDDDIMVKGNLGYYLIVDHLLRQESEGDSRQGLGVFFQIGSAPGDQNLIRTFASAGINYTGLFVGRDEDVLFVGILNSSLHKDLVEQQGLDNNRSIIEFNYAFRFGEHFALQPDFQYIINPGANPGLDNALLGILRFSMNY